MTSDFSTVDSDSRPAEQSPSLMKKRPPSQNLETSEPANGRAVGGGSEGGLGGKEGPGDGKSTTYVKWKSCPRNQVGISVESLLLRFSVTPAKTNERGTIVAHFMQKVMGVTVGGNGTLRGAIILCKINEKKICTRKNLRE